MKVTGRLRLRLSTGSTVKVGRVGAHSEIPVKVSTFDEAGLWAWWDDDGRLLFFPWHGISVIDFGMPEDLP